ncbi:hypothetical protein V8U11_06125 [Pseudomonas chlororaphis]|uniref:hypothetical protein n=1 Tax=Pseudomonas chlororaphis TaxID=587753 RepID=UPI0030CBF27C
MNIERYSVEALSQSSALNESDIVPLDQRMKLRSEGGGGLDPEFDQFYTELMKFVSESTSSSSGGIQQYLKQYVNAGGEQAYNTSKKQMDALTQVMVRMKEQGLQDSPIYKEISTALVSVSTSNMFVLEFMQEVFKPSDDDNEDDRANTNW